MPWGVCQADIIPLRFTISNTNSIDSMFEFEEMEEEKAFIDRGRVFTFLLSYPPSSHLRRSSSVVDSFPRSSLLSSGPKEKKDKDG